MSSEKEIKKISKFLSFILRHNPGTIGLTLDGNGWADVNTLMEKSNESGISLTPELLKHVVETNTKKRFAFNEQETKIRANQGHSIAIELDLTPIEPPATLYHGTAEPFVNAILDKGLDKQQRHHVHLSPDIETALNVGQRHGRPVIFKVNAEQMYKDGYQFFVSENGVWLTDNVPIKYLAKQDAREG